MKNQKNPERTKKILLAALEKNLGLISQSCKEVGICRTVYYNYLKEDEEFKKRVDEINEATIDFVEGQLYNKIKEGSEKSILFYMRYKGKKRGYTESVDITSNGEKLSNVQIEIIKKDDK